MHARFNWSAVLLLLSAVLYAGPAAAQNLVPVADGNHWQPLCAENHTCSRPYDLILGGGASGYNPLNRFAAGPLVVSDGMILQMGEPLLWRVNPSSGLGQFPGLDDPGGAISDVNSVSLRQGFTMSFSLFGRSEGVNSAELRDGDNRRISSSSWHGKDALNLNNAAMIAPAVTSDGRVYAGVRGGGGTQLFHSFDRGRSWTQVNVPFRIGDDRFNLLASPSGIELWAINSEFFDQPISLWTSSNRGANWTRVDDGSLPANTVRIVHHPGFTGTSFALSDTGLFVSFNEGRSWQATGWNLPVNGLTFVPASEDAAAGPGDSWTLVLGGDDGAWASRDEGESWFSLSRGLPALPTTVAYKNRALVAVSDAGFFTCRGSACSGMAMALPAPAPSDIVILREFFSPAWGLYRMAESVAELAGTDALPAPEDWVATGNEFAVWSLASSATTSSLCEFERLGSDGKRTRFLAATGAECRGLIGLQDQLPEDSVKWRILPYRHAVVPTDSTGQCPRHTQPVFRLYNTGGVVNHRYLLEKSLREEWPQLAPHWTLEGRAFCAPG